MFKEFKKNVGDLTPGQEVTVLFELENDEYTIEKATGSCGCTNVVVGDNKKTVSAAYTADQIPYHLEDVGVIHIAKNIDVTLKKVSDDTTLDKKLMLFGSVYKQLENK